MAVRPNCARESLLAQNLPTRPKLVAGRVHSSFQQALHVRGSCAPIFVPGDVGVCPGYSDHQSPSTRSSGGSVIAVPGPCSLTDAVAAANSGATVQNCVGGTGPNEIVFAVTGTITLGATLVTTAPELAIIGPSVGGITISGANTEEIIDASAGNLALGNLTFTEGGNVLFGGAIYAEGTNLTIENSTFSDNGAGTDLTVQVPAIAAPMSSMRSRR